MTTDDILTPHELATARICGRRLWYRRMGVRLPRTEAMRRGVKAEREWRRTKPRRPRRWLDATLHHGLAVRCPTRGLSGAVDAVWLGEDADGRPTGIPIEFEWAEPPVRPAKRLQVMAYALMVESTFDVVVPRVRVVQQDHGAPVVTHLPVTDGERARVESWMQRIRGWLADESLPPPAPIGHCLGCRYVRWCNDRL